MALVPLVLDLFDGALNPVIAGTAYLVPSVQLTDPGTGIAVTSGPSVPFRPGNPTPLTWILPTDVSGWAPSGWGWDISFSSSTPGSPAPYSFKITSSGYLYSFTSTSASPAVFTASGSSLTNGTAVALAPGSAPGGFRSNTVYYVVDVSGDTFSLAASAGGTAIAGTTAGSGSLGVVQYLSSFSPQSDVVSTFPLNPMTTLGDTIWGGASGIPQRLPGNTDDELAVYTQTGTGSASAEPAWLTGSASLAQALGAVSPQSSGSMSLPLYLVPAPSGDETGTTDTPLIQAVENAANTFGGGKLIFAPGDYWVTGLVKKALTYWEGAGEDATVLNLAASAGGDVVQGYDFGSLSLTGAKTPSVSGIWDFGIAGMTIDGNRANQSAASFGVRVYGYNWIFRDLCVRNCYSSGLWTEWGIASTDAPVDTAGYECTAINMKVGYNGSHGWMHLGPSDCRMFDVITYKNNQAGTVSGIGLWAMQDQVSNVCLTASSMNGVTASGFTGTFSVQAATLGNPTDLYSGSGGTLQVATTAGRAVMTYTGKTATAFTGCTVTSGSGTFATANALTTYNAVTGKGLWTCNGLQLTTCHSWGYGHTWATVWDGGVTDAGCHWEGAEYGQLLIRYTANKAGGYVYDFSTIPSGLGIQMGDDGSTPAIPQSASCAATSCSIWTRASAFINDTAARSAVNWVNANTSSVDVLGTTNVSQVFTTTLASGSNGTDLSTFTSESPGTIYVATTADIPASPGTLTVATAEGNQTATFTGTNGSNAGSRTAGTQFLGVVAEGAPFGSTMSTGGAVALANIGTVVAGGTVDAASRVRVQAEAGPNGVSPGASLVYESGPHTWDVGTSGNGFLIKSNGVQQVNYNASAKQWQFPQGQDTRWYSDSYETLTAEINGSSGAAKFATIAATGLTGATTASRYVGATTSGPPASGSFDAGDYVIDQSGTIWICTASGTAPAGWQRLNASGICGTLIASGQTAPNGEMVFPRTSALQSNTMVSGTAVLSFFQAGISQPATDWILTLTGGTEASGLTVAQAGVYSMPLDAIYNINQGLTSTLLASVSDTTMWAATYTPYARQFAASCSLVAGNWYAVALLAVGTTPPSIQNCGNSGFAAPYLGCTLSGLSTLPSTFTLQDAGDPSLLPQACVSSVNIQ